jgi:hypothetical protein
VDGRELRLARHILFFARSRVSPPYLASFAPLEGASVGLIPLEGASLECIDRYALLFYPLFKY